MKTLAKATIVQVTARYLGLPVRVVRVKASGFVFDFGVDGVKEGDYELGDYALAAQAAGVTPSEMQELVEEVA